MGADEGAVEVGERKATSTVSEKRTDRARGSDSDSDGGACGGDRSLEPPRVVTPRLALMLAGTPLPVIVPLTATSAAIVREGLEAGGAREEGWRNGGGVGREEEVEASVGWLTSGSRGETEEEEEAEGACRPKETSSWTRSYGRVAGGEREDGVGSPPVDEKQKRCHRP